MENLDLNNYIQQARKSGMGDEKIREGLLQVGRSEADISEALKSSARVLGVEPKPKWLARERGTRPGHPTRMQKNIAVVGTILIIILAFGYAYASYLSAKNYNEINRQAEEVQKATQALEQKRAANPMATWQTYTNTEYGFEFRYPGDWGSDVYRPYIATGIETSIVAGELAINFKPKDIIFFVTSREILDKNGANFPPIHSPKNWDEDKAMLQSGKCADERAIECKISNINNLITLERSKYWPPGGTQSKMFTFYNDGLRYDLVMFESIDDVNMLNQILSTFRFVK